MSEKENGLEVGPGRTVESPGGGQYPRKQRYSSRDKREYSSVRQGYPSSGRPLYPHRSPNSRGYSDKGGGRRSEQRRHGVKEVETTSPGVSPARPGSGDVKKKPTPVSLNHLLNFTIAPRERYSGSGPFAHGIRRRRSNITHSFNKEQFLQANCQFVVSASGEYGVHSGDPDLIVDWEKIEQVRLFCHQIPSCPICLYPPTAAKITRCGHVYCWSCVLHYLSLSEKRWRKCPICYESIHKGDLKSVTALSSQQYKAMDTITMKLMMREKGSMQLFPKSQWAERKQGLLALQGMMNNQFVKLLTATPAQVLDHIIGPEKAQLTHQLKNLAKDEVSEECFVESALAELKAREVELLRARTIDQEVTDIVQGIEAAMSSDDGKTQQQTVQAVASKSVWTAYSDVYFEGEFEAPFSDSEEDVSTGSSGSGSSEDPTPRRTVASQESSPEDPTPRRTVASQESSPEDPGPRRTVASQESSPEDPTPRRTVASQESSPEDPTPRRTVASQESSPEDPTPRRTVASQESSPGGSRRQSVSSQTDSSPELPSVTSPRSLSGGEFVYFYQASDGQHLYLHPVNVKCMAKEYGGLENCPDEIKASIVQMDQLSMTESVRSRYRFLSHLPLTCEFVLCELDLKPPTLSRETLRLFSDELQNRRQKRQKKKREEKRRERKAVANSPPADTFPMLIPSHNMTPETFHNLLSFTSSPSPTSEQPHRDRTGVPPTAKGDDDVPSAPSFAQALRGKPPPVWPTSKAQGAAKQKETPLKVEDCDEEYSVPSFQEAFNDALILASEAQKDSSGKPGSKTAKKGRKKLVLFSTGGARGTT